MIIICILVVSGVGMLYLRPPDPAEDLTGIPQQIHICRWSSGMYDPIVGEWKVESS
jgi:hypothetical protein